MSTRTGLLRIMALISAAACGDASTSTRGAVDLPPRGGEDVAEASDDEGAGETLAPPAQQEEEEDLSGLPVAMNDADKDGIADEKDCDANNPAIGLRLVEDALAAESTLFSAADGFSTASWSFADSAYRQTRLVDDADATFFMGDQGIGDVEIEVRAASTDVTTISPRLRQMFVLVG